MSKAIVQIFFTIDDSLACFLIKKMREKLERYERRNKLTPQKQSLMPHDMEEAKQRLL